MSWFLISLIAQFILGTSALADKLLLKKTFPNPVGYTFWLGIFGLISAVLLPFDFVSVSWQTLMMALVAGGAFILGMLFYFYALFYSKAGGSIVSVSGFSPIATLVFGSFFFGTVLQPYQMIGFVLLICGGFLVAFLEEKQARLWTLFFVLVAAGCLGASNVLSKQVFDAANFITGFFWIKVGGVCMVSLFLLYAPWRRALFSVSGENRFRNKKLYVLNRAYAGAGSVLVFYAISLGVPALVDAMQSIRFFIVFLGGWLFLHAKFRLRALAGEFVAFTLISVAVLLLGVGDYLERTPPDPNRSIEWGVTFSQKFSQELSRSGSTAKFGWQENYDAFLDDLGVRHLRLIAYWDLLEPQEGVFDFSGLDYQMRRAEEVGADVILAMGKKTPRWPECHAPEWAGNLEAEQFRAKLLQFEKVVISRYKNSPALKYWQVENEPFLAFGDCSTVSRELVDAEISYVRSLDAGHPILVTDSGELGLWYSSAKRGDVFGTTMYRRVYNEVLGFYEYPIGPWFFRIKEQVIRFLVQDYEKEFIVIELGMEPWLPRALRDAPLEDQLRVFDFPFFQDSIYFAKDAGFDEYYLWGVEWWYWMKIQHGDSRFWDAARELFT
ncbi:MAG: hypothetical protein A3J54_00825 [Candidatus Ryanbacteria bacterium RIFCSPHIGHO2_02_FULL_45_13b]|uniref:Glycoside hydrolase family 42 N-terminal domain-containing protein n=1 Tax=Candidatus Ryanbacteria bacterium RIFCSPHIGHO2_02_FULL_45_13b TaxID=1802117 RepID=A0A1G2G6S9_9BACT|nr:MAG: hypothetical protein A3J54_00825 [Candidatus Ryanbacteria bacterium RIFCSPHIGHO2_02_FULL_45_13b]